jgi:DNA-binding transcriptional LysR family regulator
MKLPALRAFLDLVETGNFRATARRLRISVSALSLQIRALETDLGAPLLVRDRRGCALTPAGRQALPLARSLTALAGRLETLFREPRLPVAASSNIGTYLLPPLCRRFQDETALRPELNVADNPACAARLREGRADCAVLEWWDATPGFHGVVWRREPLVIITPPDHPWTRREHLLSDDLTREPLLGGESGSGTGTVLRRALGERASKLRVSMQLGGTEAVKQAVMNGLGVSLVMAAAVRRETAEGRLWSSPLADVALHKDLHAVCREDGSAEHGAKRFQEFLATSR